MAETDPKRTESRDELVADVKRKHGDDIARIVERFIDGDIGEKSRRYYEPTEDY